MRTRLTEMLGIEHPVMLAGMGGVSYAVLVAAVSDAGGFGTLGAATMASEELDKEMGGVRAATDRPCASRSWPRAVSSTGAAWRPRSVWAPTAYGSAPASSRPPKRAPFAGTRRHCCARPRTAR